MRHWTVTALHIDSNLWRPEQRTTKAVVSTQHKGIIKVNSVCNKVQKTTQVQREETANIFIYFSQFLEAVPSLVASSFERHWRLWALPGCFEVSMSNHPGVWSGRRMIWHIFGLSFSVVVIASQRRVPVSLYLTRKRQGDSHERRLVHPFRHLERISTVARRERRPVKGDGRAALRTTRYWA